MTIQPNDESRLGPLGALYYGHTDMEIIAVAGQYLTMEQLVSMDAEAEGLWPKWLPALADAIYHSRHPENISPTAEEIEDCIAVLLQRMSEQQPRLLEEIARCTANALKKRAKKRKRLADDTLRATIYSLRKEGAPFPSALVAKILNRGLKPGDDKWRTETRYKQLYAEAQKAHKNDPNWLKQVDKASRRNMGYTIKEWDQYCNSLEYNQILERVSDAVADVAVAHMRNRKKRGKKIRPN